MAAPGFVGPTKRPPWLSSSYSAYACSTRSRTRSCAAASAIGRSSAKLRRSPLTEYWRAGNVTLRPLPLRRSQTANPISFKPSSTPSVKCSSASASLPGGLRFVVRNDLDDHDVTS